MSRWLCCLWLLTSLLPVRLARAADPAPAAPAAKPADAIKPADSSAPAPAATTKEAAAAPNPTPLKQPADAAAKAAAAGSDQPVPNFQLRDIHQQRVALADFANQRLVVLAFLGVECPLAKLYAPRLEKIAADYRPKGVVVLGIDSNSQDSLAELTAYARVHGIEFPLLKDPSGAVADRLQATRMTEVFVLDKRRVVRYHGRIDDQYGVGSARPEPKQNDLRAALDELLAGKPVSQPRTKVAGCLIGRTHKPDEASPVTYAGQIAPLLDRRCVECHRPGQIGPFSLTDYEEAAAWADMIGEVVAEERMPPWHANPRVGHFVGDRRLSDEEKGLFQAWVAAGAPRGGATTLAAAQTGAKDKASGADDKQDTAGDKLIDADVRKNAAGGSAGVENDGDATNILGADAGGTPAVPAATASAGPGKEAPPAADPASWALEHKPDVVIPMRAKPFKVPAQGVLTYKFFKVDPGIKKDRWIKAAEVLPGNRAVVHHVIVHAFVGDFRDAILEGATDGFLAAYVPGMRPASYPPGMAKLLPAGSQLLFQVHYVANGSEQLDCCRLGLIFAKEADVKYEVVTSAVKNRSLVIPPRSNDYTVSAESSPAPSECRLLCMMPHMHLRGAAFNFELLLPGERPEPLLDIPHYDFNWQTAYRLVEPRTLPPGSRLRCTARFDNSADNLNNPDPTKTIRWGSQSKDEMMVGYFDVAFPRSAGQPWRTRLASPMD